MTEKEFRKKMLEARKLSIRPWLYNNYQGNCVNLAESFMVGWDDENEIPELFSEIFAPNDGHLIPYWLGVRSKGNSARRLFFLELFEEYMVVNQYYLAY